MRRDTTGFWDPFDFRSFERDRHFLARFFRMILYNLIHIDYSLREPRGRGIIRSNSSGGGSVVHVAHS